MTIADRPFAILQSTDSDRSSSVTTQVSGYRNARRRRAQVVLLTFGLLAAVFAVIIALRAAVWLPIFHH